MKNFCLSILLLFSLFRLSGQDQAPANQKELVSYLVRNVLLPDRDSGGVVLIRHHTRDIKHYKPDVEVRYWSIIEKYFPGLHRDTLRKKVECASWIDKRIEVPPFRIYFPEVKPDSKQSFTDLYRKYHEPIFSVSNIVYSNDGTVCILYLAGFQAGAFTVEIRKNPAGKWASHQTTPDWFE